ncbi:MAG: TIR domain-containing protein [Candidatus Kentron sp. G]|nr:MAG: TIR domain-containing protein [Candidatus Kentron sp. G]VFM95970.1 MAG: TIR domain-containing protein [Candidatus Kentron sp. G]VFM97490.1 MAG: TIR domain-containing protein [Candidatus Kentron sp. G]
MTQKTVFLSHRRDAAGRGFARSMEQALTHRGYDVFLDVDAMESGRWAEQLRREVPCRAHFLLLLTPNALERCSGEGDWVRQEYELAVRHGRNIVPIREESFDTGRERATCPDAMRGVFDWQIATVAHGSFERDMDELVRRYIPPHKAPNQEEPPKARFEPQTPIPPGPPPIPAQGGNTMPDNRNQTITQTITDTTLVGVTLNQGDVRGDLRTVAEHIGTLPAAAEAGKEQKLAGLLGQLEEVLADVPLEQDEQAEAVVEMLERTVADAKKGKAPHKK